MGYVLGIDIGTTYSACAIGDRGRFEVFQLGIRRSAIPSVVAVRDDGAAVTGEAAERPGLAPSRIAREFKRRLGDPTPLLLGGVPYGAEALTARLLAAILARVREERGDDPVLVVITHPAGYGPYKLSFLEEAARLANVTPVRFLAEPVAAAIDYAAGQRMAAGELLAVYDFGGGTLDVAALRKATTGFELVGTPAGMERFGGSDLDQAVFAHVLQSLHGAADGLDPADPAVVSALQALREACREAKEALSFDTDATVPVRLPGIHTEVRLTRAEFEEMLRPRLHETVGLLQRVVGGSGATMADVARVLLAGGASRIPLVAETIREETGRPVALDANPKSGVALGAARHGWGLVEAGQVAAPVSAPPQQAEAATAPVEAVAAAAQAEVLPAEAPAAEALPVAAPAQAEVLLAEAPPAAVAVVSEPPPPSVGAPSRSAGRRSGRPRLGRRATALGALVTAGTLAAALVGGALLGGRGDPGASTPRPTVLPSATLPEPSANPPASPTGAGSPAEPAVTGNQRVVALYYPSFGPQGQDQEWRMWADAPGAAPPGDIASDFYPVLGPYASIEPAVIDRHFRWLADAGVGAVAIVWSTADPPGEPVVATLLAACERSGLRATFWLELGETGRIDAASGALDRLVASYGENGALLRTEAPSPWLEGARPRVVFVVDGLEGQSGGGEAPPPEVWRPLLDRLHADSNAVVLAAATDPAWVEAGHFDGLAARGSGATASEGYSWARALPAGAWYAPIVLPGRSGDRIGATSPGLGRQEGATLREQWAAALSAGRDAQLIVVDSFNGWPGGTQIEPARSDIAELPRPYLTYEPLPPEGYLELTRSLIESLPH